MVDHVKISAAVRDVLATVIYRLRLSDPVADCKTDIRSPRGFPTASGERIPG
jgi:hypothetical protein